MMEVDDFKAFLEESMPGAKVNLRDLTGTGDHFDADIVWPNFEGKTRLECHRMVMSVVEDLLKGPLHAFTFRTYVRES
jgi:stress-induced morphogen